MECARAGVVRNEWERWHAALNFSKYFRKLKYLEMTKQLSNKALLTLPNGMARICFCRL